MSQELIPGLPDKWKLIHCSATNPDNPDHPMGKWRDADILNLLREIATLTQERDALRLALENSLAVVQSLDVYGRYNAVIANGLAALASPEEKP